VKLVGIDPANPARGLPRIQGVVVLFDPPGPDPAACSTPRR
jgi:ornithine cyclodeaminase/alanine dehydrogenase-like protein (mu-crystallin family)